MVLAVADTVVDRLAEAVADLAAAEAAMVAAEAVTAVVIEPLA